MDNTNRYTASRKITLDCVESRLVDKLDGAIDGQNERRNCRFEKVVQVRNGAANRSEDQKDVLPL